MAVTEWDGATFEAHRPLLFSIAYRMLGSASGAEECHSGHMAPNIPVRDCQNRWANRRSGVIPDDGVPRESQSELARARRIRGATRRITDVVVEQVITDRIKATARHATHSSTRSTWQACGLSQTAVASPEGLPRCKTLRLARGQRRLKEPVHAEGAIVS